MIKCLIAIPWSGQLLRKTVPAGSPAAMGLPPQEKCWAPNRQRLTTTEETLTLWLACRLSGDYAATKRLVIDYARQFLRKVQIDILGNNCAWSDRIEHPYLRHKNQQTNSHEETLEFSIHRTHGCPANQWPAGIPGERSGSTSHSHSPTAAVAQQNARGLGSPGEPGAKRRQRVDD
jgi:hypothetical protein